MFTLFWEIVTCDCHIHNPPAYDSDSLGEKDAEGSKKHRKFYDSDTERHPEKPSVNVYHNEMPKCLVGYYMIKVSTVDSTN
jgi:hypothetical protein